MKFFILSLIVGFFLGDVVPVTSSALLHTCNGNDLEQCALSADSLLKDPSLVFPDSPSSLDRVCRTWNEFTACIYDYTKNCFTQIEKSRFDEQFKEPAMSMNSLCQDQTYRKEYFKVAPCIQKITTNEAFCGFQYRFLIDQISGSVVTMKQLCCAREKFRQCILLKTASICAGEDKFFGRQRPGELNSTTFAIQVLDKSLAFIAQQCSLPSLQNGECPGIETQPPFYKVNHRYDKIPPEKSSTDSKFKSSLSPNKDGNLSIPNFLTGNINNINNKPSSSSKSPEYKLDSNGSTNSKNNSLVNNKLNEIIKSAGPFNRQQTQNDAINGNRLQNDQNPQQSHLSRSTNEDANDSKNSGYYWRDYSTAMLTACTLVSAIITLNISF